MSKYLLTEKQPLTWALDEFTFIYRSPLDQPHLEFRGKETMESHPSYTVLSPWMAKYPRSSSSLFQAFNDIVYAQKWDDVEVIDLEPCSRGVIRGKKRDTNEIMHVLPCSLSENLSFSWIQEAFEHVFPNESDTRSIFLAITSSDASIVYYKLSNGLVKPPM